MTFLSKKKKSMSVKKINFVGLSMNELFLCGLSVLGVPYAPHVTDFGPSFAWVLLGNFKDFESADKVGVCNFGFIG